MDGWQIAKVRAIGLLMGAEDLERRLVRLFDRLDLRAQSEAPTRQSLAAARALGLDRAIGPTVPRTEGR